MLQASYGIGLVAGMKEGAPFGGNIGGCGVVVGGDAVCVTGHGGMSTGATIGVREEARGVPGSQR